MVALIAEITSCFEFDMCLMTRRMETLNLMLLGRQLELIITSIKLLMVICYEQIQLISSRSGLLCSLKM